MLSRPQPRIFTRVYLTVCLNQSVYICLPVCPALAPSGAARWPNPARAFCGSRKAEARPQSKQSKQSAGYALSCCPPLITVVLTPESDQNRHVHILKRFLIGLFLHHLVIFFFFFFARESITDSRGRCRTDGAGPCRLWCYMFTLTGLSSADRTQTRRFSFYSSSPSSYLPPPPQQIGCLGHFFAVY